MNRSVVDAAGHAVRTDLADAQKSELEHDWPPNMEKAEDDAYKSRSGFPLTGVIDTVDGQVWNGMKNRVLSFNVAVSE